MMILFDIIMKGLGKKSMQIKVIFPLPSLD